MRSISSAQMREIVREEVQKIVEKELLKLRISLLPLVSDEEQDEIEKMFGEEPDCDKIIMKKNAKI
jgi:hypothetical protein